MCVCVCVCVCVCFLTSIARANRLANEQMSAFSRVCVCYFVRVLLRACAADFGPSLVETTPGRRLKGSASQRSIVGLIKDTSN